jgi:ubiquinone/menaquinone biosynthesis C-methylase UbiE
MSVLLWLLGIVVLVIAGWSAAHLRSRRNPRAFPPWMTPILELPWRNRGRILDRVGVSAGERVLEVGPGAGWITQEAAARVGPGGRTVCLDLQRDMLRKVRARLGAAAELVQASGSRLPFRDGAFDRAFLVHVLGEIPDKDGACAELFRVLRPGGVLAVEEGVPDPDYIPRARLLRLVEHAGFEARERFGGWSDYTQRFTRP